MNIKRYAQLAWNDGELTEYENGQWCEFEDVEKCFEEYEKRIKELEKLLILKNGRNLINENL